jgi:subtilisin family serine protease
VFEAALPEFGSGENHLMTNLPAAFSGGDVGAIVGANTFYTNGITGQSAVMANVEAGHIWNGHESLGHVATFSHHADAFGTTTAQLFDRHATWVGMTMGGRNAPPPGVYQSGIAPNASLRSGAVASGWNGNAYSLGFNFTGNSFANPYVANFGTADVINSSWGFTDDPGTNFFTIAMDGLANSNPRTTFVASAGNDGPPVDTVGSPGSGYNAITVAALRNDGFNNYSAVANFSSRGPQSYGDPVNGFIAGIRAAVDIAAPGTNLTSAYFGGQAGGNHPGLPGSPNGAAGAPNFYTFSVQGTSFAAPIVAGAAALIDSASYNTPLLAANPASRDARVVKSVLLNSATKIAGWNNGQVPHVNGNGGVETVQALDYASGAGALNLDRAYDQYLSGLTRDVPGTLLGNQGPVDVIGWDFGVVQNGILNTYPIALPLAAGTDLTVTLDWFRNRAFNAGTFVTSDSSQVDLDLRIRDIITGNLISESISGVNVVEHLHFPVPRTSLYQIEVHYFGNIFGNPGSEEYGLAWYATGIPEPSAIVLMLLAMFAIPLRRAR